VTEQAKLVLASGSPRRLAQRLSAEKGKLVAGRAREAGITAFVLAADTVVAVGRRILPKPEIQDEAEACLRLLSGRTHRVYTGVTLIDPRGREHSRLVETRVRFKRLSGGEISDYLACGEWRGKAGGYAIQGIAGSFVIKLVGSYSNVVGLPLTEAVGLLSGYGYDVRAGWVERAA